MPAELQSRYLMELRLEVTASHIMGDTPQGMRRVDVLNKGRFTGPRLNGVTLEGASDLLLRTGDQALKPDVRVLLKTDDDALILLTYRGVRHGPDAVMARIAAGEAVAPEEYYLRTVLQFETASETYDWLNRILAVGVGRREPNGVTYDVFEIL